MRFIVLFLGAVITAQANWKLDTGLTLSHFQQQVKTSLEGERGERLVNDAALGVTLSGLYGMKSWLWVGAFAHLDWGAANTAEFAGFDANGAATVQGKIGGPYTEFWAGPMVRAYWRRLFFELGYGAFGTRKDGARRDLPNTSGSNSGSFSTSASVAWLFGLGGEVALRDRLWVTLKMRYRIRYYDERDGEALAAGVHGTQDVTPFFGLGFSL